MEVSLTDDKVEDVIRWIPNGEDVYVTMHGKEKQVMSRMRGGGKHKDKKSKAEKKQAESGKTLEQKFVEEVRCDKSPTRQESTSDVNQETQEKNEDKMIHVLDEDSMKSWVEFWSKESDNEVGQKMENWMSVLQGVQEVDVERANIWKCGMRWAVEARRKQRRQQEQEQWRQDEQKQREQRQAEQGQNTGQEQSKQVSTKKNCWKRCERKTLKW